MGSGGGVGWWWGGGHKHKLNKIVGKIGGVRGGSFEEDIEAVQDNMYQGLMIRA